MKPGFLHGTFYFEGVRFLMQKQTHLYRLVLTAVLLAVGFVLPYLTGQIPAIGKVVSPLHIPVLIAGLTCGPVYGAALGAALPLLRGMILVLPRLMPTAVAMAFEMAGYGLMTGLMYALLRRSIPVKNHLPAMLGALVIAMAAGRCLGGAAMAVLLGGQYTFAAFVAAYFTGTAVGAVIHLILVPAVVTALEKARLSPLG